MDASTTPRKLWEHPDPKSTQMWQFMQGINKKFGCNLQVSVNQNAQDKVVVLFDFQR